MPDIATESSITKKLNSLINSEYFAWKITTTSRGGMPDCLYIGPENNLWVEFKRSQTVLTTIHAYRQLTRLQTKTLKQLHELNEKIWIVEYTPIGFYILRHPNLWEKPIATSLLQVYDVYGLAKEIQATIGDPDVPLNKPRNTRNPNNLI